MCGRFTFAISPELFDNLFGIYILEDLLRLYLMEVYPVSPLVNNPRNDSPACIEPLQA